MQFSLQAASPETFGYTLGFLTSALDGGERKASRRFIPPRQEAGWVPES